MDMLLSIFFCFCFCFFVIDDRGKLLFVFGNAFGLKENDHYIYKEVKRYFVKIKITAA